MTVAIRGLAAAAGISDKTLRDVILWWENEVQWVTVSRPSEAERLQAKANIYRLKFPLVTTHLSLPGIGPHRYVVDSGISELGHPVWRFLGASGYQVCRAVASGAGTATEIRQSTGLALSVVYHRLKQAKIHGLVEQSGGRYKIAADADWDRVADETGATGKALRQAAYNERSGEGFGAFRLAKGLDRAGLSGEGRLAPHGSGHAVDGETQEIVTIEEAIERLQREEAGPVAGGQGWG